MCAFDRGGGGGSGGRAVDKESVDGAGRMAAGGHIGGGRLCAAASLKPQSVAVVVAINRKHRQQAPFARLSANMGRNQNRR